MYKNIQIIHSLPCDLNIRDIIDVLLDPTSTCWFFFLLKTYTLKFFKFMISIMVYFECYVFLLPFYNTSIKHTPFKKGIIPAIVLEMSHVALRPSVVGRQSLTVNRHGIVIETALLGVFYHTAPTTARHPPFRLRR